MVHYTPQCRVSTKILTKFDGESRRQFHVTELPQFVKVFVWSNNLQNVQESAVGELHTSYVYLHTPCTEYDVMTISCCWWLMNRLYSTCLIDVVDTYFLISIGQASV